MGQIEVINLLIQVVGGLFVALIAVLGWVGMRIHDRLDSINRTLAAIERDLRSELTALDRRVTRVEAHALACPGPIKVSENAADHW